MSHALYHELTTPGSIQWARFTSPLRAQRYATLNAEYRQIIKKVAQPMLILLNATPDAELDVPLLVVFATCCAKPPYEKRATRQAREKYTVREILAFTLLT